MTKFNVGDIIRVTRRDGKIYDCFVVENVERHQLFCGKVLRNIKGKVPTTSWVRYGLHKDATCQFNKECLSIEVLSKGQRTSVPDVRSEVYRNRFPGTNQPVTFCLSESKTGRYGGWSNSEEESCAILESYNRSQEHANLSQLLESVRCS